MLFNIALNYGGRAEIVDAARRLIEAGIAPDELDERRFSEFLYTAGQPDPDLLIRTSGEMRVSNFLLWQIAYAEIWVTDTLWPDFRAPHLLRPSSTTRSASAATAASSRRASRRSVTRVLSGVVLLVVLVGLPRGWRRLQALVAAGRGRRRAARSSSCARALPRRSAPACRGCPARASRRA